MIYCARPGSRIWEVRLGIDIDIISYSLFESEVQPEIHTHLWISHEVEPSGTSMTECGWQAIPYFQTGYRYFYLPFDQFLHLVFFYPPFLVQEIFT